MDEGSIDSRSVNEQTACVIFEEPKAARRAWRALRNSGLPRPTQIGLHQGEISQDQYSVAQSRSRFGTLAGALVVGIPTAVFLGVAASADVLHALTTPVAVAGGLIGGSLLGGLAGMLVGTTEPPAIMARARDAVRHGEVALVASFRSQENARKARELLVKHPGAVRAVGAAG